MLQIVSHTPTWVFALFAGLLVFGLIQTRSRNVNKALAFLLPLGMIALSLSGIQSSFGLKPMPLLAWTVGLSAVTFIGHKLFPNRGIVFDLEKNSFFIPGSWTPLAVIMAIFFTKYVFAVMQGLGANAASSPLVAVVLSFAYGCFSGYFCARAASLVMAARRPNNSFKPKPLRGSA